MNVLSISPLEVTSSALFLQEKIRSDTFSTKFVDFENLFYTQKLRGKHTIRYRVRTYMEEKESYKRGKSREK